MAERWSIEGLRYVRAVAETSSFSEAARTYGVTQPALSNGIAKVEDRLGERLFERSPRGVTQTAFGMRLIPLLDRVLVDLDAAVAEARRLTTRSVGAIHLGTSPLIRPDLVAAAYQAVCSLADARDLVLRESNMDDLRTGLIDGSIDMALIPSVGPLPRFEHRIIDSEPIVLVDSLEHGDEPIDVGETADVELILVQDACGLTTFTRLLFEEVDRPLQQYPGEATSYRVLEEWARLGLGAALLPLSKLGEQPRSHRPVMEHGQPVEIFYEAVWNPDSPSAGVFEQVAGRLIPSP